MLQLGKTDGWRSFKKILFSGRRNRILEVTVWKIQRKVRLMFNNQSYLVLFIVILQYFYWLLDCVPDCCNIGLEIMLIFELYILCCLFIVETVFYSVTRRFVYFYPHMSIGKLWIYCLSFVCVCVFLRLRISPPRIKLAASKFAPRFIGVQGRESQILVNFAPTEAQNQTNRPAHGPRPPACKHCRRDVPT